MSKKTKSGEFSVWSGHHIDAPVHLVPASPPKPLEVNGAPIVEQAHEYVIRKPKSDAAN